MAAIKEVGSVYQAWQMLKLHGAWPDPGGWFDQPNAVIRAVRILDGAQAQYERDEMERAKSRG